eukprot:3238754-Prymnesium_polylepis.1
MPKACYEHRSRCVLVDAIRFQSSQPMRALRPRSAGSQRTIYTGHTVWNGNLKPTRPSSAGSARARPASAGSTRPSSPQATSPRDSYIAPPTPADVAFERLNWALTEYEVDVSSARPSPRGTRENANDQTLVLSLEEKVLLEEVEAEHTKAAIQRQLRREERERAIAAAKAEQVALLNLSNMLEQMGLRRRANKMAERARVQVEEDR